MVQVGARISIKTLLIFLFKALKSEFEKKAKFLTDVSESTLDKCSEPKHVQPPRELTTTASVICPRNN